MLQSIFIQNYALIDTLEISFEKGFSVITGETGAGKSIILGAIGLLLGQRADSKAIKNGASKCIIEAKFDISEYNLESFFQTNDLEFDPQECILRRELQVSGKSRAFINDVPTSLTMMRELGEKLIDIHSQHQNLLLHDENFQLKILDILAHNEKERDTYKEIYKEYKTVSKELDRLTEEAEKSKTDEDYIRFQLEQLEEAKLEQDEQEKLEQEAETLSHAEEIKAKLYQVSQLMETDENGLLSQMKEGLHILRNLQKVYAPATEQAERLENCFIEMKDITQEISNRQEEIEFNPDRLNFVNERLNLIYSLEQKHRVSNINELIICTENYRQRLQNITFFESRLQELTDRKSALYNKVKEQAKVLTRQRIQAGKKIQAEMEKRLIPLGMPHIRFQVQIDSRKEPDACGSDTVDFLFSANKNGQLQKISSVASGGEIARVMLSIKAMMASNIQLPTIIFDEIDTGISGEIADKMAAIMEEMGQCMQVISITHLPQIASRGSIHYKVFKEDSKESTNSHICRLAQPERIEEIARMLSGASLTDAAINNAKELLGNKK